MDFFEELLMEIFAFGAGFIFGKSSEKEKKEEKTEIYIPERFITTKSGNPSIAEQMINIMNYNGENQREENYE